MLDYYKNYNPNFSEIIKQLEINRNYLYGINNIIPLKQDKAYIIKQFEIFGSNILSLSRIKGLKKEDRNKLMSLINRIGLYWYNLVNAYKNIGDEILYYGNLIRNYLKNIKAFYILENTENPNHNVNINFLKNVISREFTYSESYPLDSTFINRFFYALSERYHRRDKYRVRLLIENLKDYVDSLPAQDEKFRKEIQRRYGKKISYKNKARAQALADIHAKLLDFLKVDIEQFVYHEEP